ncbi:MAG: 2-oxo acid dehydrogenase subunit E2 [Phycisphaerales bacterium]|nr:2-oxo acid dehydrogenase subunit E2 [Phycisphaerales bacterium]
MPIEMKMPRLSDTMEQGTVVRWAVKPGQKVRSGDVVADIETDKATMELQTFDDGTVAELAVAEGTTVKVGTIIMRLAEQGESVDAVKGMASAPAAAQASAPAASKQAVGSSAPAVVERHGVIATIPAPATSNGSHAPAGDRVFASPLARKIAAENNVDLGSVSGSGPSGRIIRKDVEAALSGPALQNRGSQQTIVKGPQAAPRMTPAPMPMAGAQLTSRSIALSNMRGTIAKRLVQSKQTIPHYQVTIAVRMDALLELRSQLNEQLAGQGVKLSVNDFLVRACALAMHSHPHVNSRWNDAGPSVDLVGDVNIGVAIALPLNERGEGGGLVVATLRSADRIGLRQISSESKRLADKARGKGLSIDEMSDSTFTISNLGMFGVEHFTAIINPPNAAILAVGAAIEQPVVKTDPKTGEKSIGIGHIMQMTMSSDHRIIDGAMAAQYLATVRELLEKPATLLV